MKEIMNFAIYYSGDSYSTAGKIMGRQSAGKAFMRGVARTWPQGRVIGVGSDAKSLEAMQRQLNSDGFSGEFLWHYLPELSAVASVGALYYPAPPERELAASRNLLATDAFSLVGVTHTICSAGAIDQIADLIFPPFKSWDAMICTSQAAHKLVSTLHTEVRDWWQSQTGAGRFVQMQLPVIPLGVDVPAFCPEPGDREASRLAFGFRDEETVFLFAGRLSFHAKANPAPVYQALEKVARQTPVVCVEAGVFHNEPIRQAFLAAQKALAPSVRFIRVDGEDESLYRQAWKGADVFVSVSDNVQETFGLTPVEAMAAGLPVVVSDWNGYRDTVRDGVDGFRVPTILPPAGAGGELALRHALGVDSYDFYIGRTSLATVAEPEALAGALLTLALDGDKRRAMGAAGLARAKAEYDWPVILKRYAVMVDELGRIRADAGTRTSDSRPTRADPFLRFAHFSSRTLGANWLVTLRPDARARLHDLLGLSMVNYAFNAVIFPQESLFSMLAELEKQPSQSVSALLSASGLDMPCGSRALMWLWKFDLVRVRMV